MSRLETDSLGVADGDSIRINFRLTLEDGTLVDGSDEDGPMAFTVGDGSLLPALESVIIGMVPGERRVRILSPEQGFGLPDPALMHEFPRASFPEDAALEPGVVMSFSGAGDEEIAGTIVAIENDRVQVDLNHPLTGHTVQFEVELAAPAE